MNIFDQDNVQPNEYDSAVVPVATPDPNDATQPEGKQIDLNDLLTNAARVLIALEAMTTQQQSDVLTALGITPGSNDFDLHDNVSDAISAISNLDRFLVSDESETGDPNRYITLQNLGLALFTAANTLRGIQALNTSQKSSARTALNLTASELARYVETLTGSDQLDAGVLRNMTTAVLTALQVFDATQEEQARTALSLSPSELARYIESLTGSDQLDYGVLRNTPTTVGAFDLHDDVNTALATLAREDRLLVSDESETGEPNRYATLATLASFIGAPIVVDRANVSTPSDHRIVLSPPGGAQEQQDEIYMFQYRDGFTAGTTNIVISVNGSSDKGIKILDGGSTRDMTLNDLTQYSFYLVINAGSFWHLIGRTQNYATFNLHNDAPTELTSLSTDDRMVISDESEANDPNRFITIDTLLEYMRANAVTGTNLLQTLQNMTTQQITDARTALNIAGFDLFEDVPTRLFSLDVADRMVISDVGTQTEPTRYTTLQDLINFFNGALSFGGFSLHDDADTVIPSLATADRILVSDESAIDDPNRYATLSTLIDFLKTRVVTSEQTLTALQGLSTAQEGQARTALGITGSVITNLLEALSGDNQLDAGALRNMVTTVLTALQGFNTSQEGEARTALGITGFDLFEDFPTRLSTLDEADRMVISDVGTQTQPTRYTTLLDLVNFFNTNLSFSHFHLHNDVTTEIPSLAGEDRILVSDETAIDDPNRYATIESLTEFILDLHNRLATESTTIADDDRIPITDESETDDPTRYATIESLKNAIGSTTTNVIQVFESFTPTEQDEARESLGFDHETVLQSLGSYSLEFTNVVSTSPRGATYISTLNEVWVVDGDDHIYRYDTNGAIQGNYDLSTGNDIPRGITYISTIDEVWVVDEDDTIYRYNTTGSLQGTYNLATGNDSAVGITYISTLNEVWVVDNDRNFYRYNTTGSLQGTYALNSENSTPYGTTYIPTIGEVWVSDADRNFYRYNTNGVLQGNYALNSGNSNPQGTTYISTIDEVWVVDPNSDEIFRYNTNGSFYVVSRLRSHNQNPEGITYISTINEMWVVDDDDTIYRYNTNAVPQGNFILDSGNNDPRGIAYISTIDEVWVVDNTDRKFYRYNTNGAIQGNYNLSTGNNTPRGITYISTIDEVWVVDDNDTIYRYNTTGSSQGTYNLPTENNASNGITYISTIDEVWVVDSTSDIIFRYNTSGGFISTYPLISENSTPTGITYISTIDEMWVVDTSDNALYRYGIRIRLRLTADGLNDVLTALTSDERDTARTGLGLQGPNFSIAQHSNALTTQNIVGDIIIAKGNTPGAPFQVGTGNLTPSVVSDVVVIMYN